MRVMLDFGNDEPGGLYLILLCALAAVAAATILAMALRRPPETPGPPRRLSGLAGLSFWLALLAFAVVSSGMLVLELIRTADLFSVNFHDYKDMLLATTVLGIVAVIATGVSALLALAAIASVGANRGKGVYGIGLAALSLVLCLTTLAALYVPNGGLHQTTRALMEQVR